MAEFGVGSWQAPAGRAAGRAAFFLLFCMLAFTLDFLRPESVPEK